MADFPEELIKAYDEKFMKPQELPTAQPAPELNKVVRQATSKAPENFLENSLRTEDPMA